MTIDAKICGIRTPEVLEAAAKHGARWVGFNFYPPSPRSVAPDLGAELARMVPTGLRSVGLFVDPTEDELGAVLGRVPLDVIQLHGSETPERVAEIRARFGKPVIKAIPVSEAADLDRAAPYEAVADYLMFDAKPPKSMANALPGGNALSFDWTLLSGRRFQRPWLLAGGLTPDNLIDAVRISGAPMVDVSSGVEDRPGEKNVSKIKAFLDASRRV